MKKLRTMTVASLLLSAAVAATLGVSEPVGSGESQLAVVSGGAAARPDSPDAPAPVNRSTGLQQVESDEPPPEGFDLTMQAGEDVPPELLVDRDGDGVVRVLVEGVDPMEPEEQRRADAALAEARGMPPRVVVSHDELWARRLTASEEACPEPPEGTDDGLSLLAAFPCRYGLAFEAVPTTADESVEDRLVAAIDHVLSGPTRTGRETGLEEIPGEASSITVDVTRSDDSLSVSFDQGFAERFPPQFPGDGRTVLDAILATLSANGVTGGVTFDIDGACLSFAISAGTDGCFEYSPSQEKVIPSHRIARGQS